MQFSKIGFFSRPVIHFSIDVDGVFAIPWRITFYHSKFPAGWLAVRQVAKKKSTSNDQTDNKVLQTADHLLN